MKDELQELEMDESTRKTATDWLMHVISGKRVNGNGNGPGPSEESTPTGGALALAEMPRGAESSHEEEPQATISEITAEDLCGAPAVPVVKVVAPADEITPDDVCWVPEERRLKPQAPPAEPAPAAKLHVMPAPQKTENLDLRRPGAARDPEFSFLTGQLEPVLTAADISKDPAPYVVEPTFNGVNSAPEVAEVTAADISRNRDWVLNDMTPSGPDMPTSFRVIRSAATTSPKIEPDAPSIEAPAPVAETAASTVETPAPLPEAFAPPPQAFAPLPEVFTAVPEAFAPMPEVFTPLPEAFAPPPDAFVPTPEFFAPVPEAFAPIIEAPVPGPETFPPAAEAFAPIIEAAAHVTETPAPVAEAPLPVLEPAPPAEPPAESGILAPEISAAPAEPVAVEVPSSLNDASTLAPEIAAVAEASAEHPAEVAEVEAPSAQEQTHAQKAQTTEAEKPLAHPEVLSAGQAEPELATGTAEGETHAMTGENVFARQGFWGNSDEGKASTKAMLQGFKDAYPPPGSGEDGKHPEGWFSAWKTMLRLGSVLPWMARALPALESGAINAEPGAASATAATGSAGVAQETRQDVAGLRLVQYEIRTTVQDHSMQLKRMEEQLTRVRESVDSQSSESTEVAENLRNMTKLVRMAGLGLGALLLVLIILVIVLLSHR